MKNKLFGIIAIIALTLTACPEPEPEHTHEWGAWQSNATEHWRACSCGEEDGRANHTGDPCTVCGYEAPPPVCVCPPNTVHPYGTDCPSNCAAKGTEHCGCTIAPPCPCPANTVHDFGTTCPDPCVGVGHEGCNCTIGPDDNVVKERLKTIDGLFDNNSSATVKGNFTKAELEDAADKIKVAINGAFNGLSTDTAKNNYKNLFSTGVNIIVEETTDYDNWKTIGDGKTIYLNFNAVNKADLSTIIVSAIGSIGRGNAETAIAPVHDNGWQRMNREAIAINNLSLLCV